MITPGANITPSPISIPPVPSKSAPGPIFTFFPISILEGTRKFDRIDLKLLFFPTDLNFNF